MSGASSSLSRRARRRLQRAAAGAAAVSFLAGSTAVALAATNAFAPGGFGNQQVGPLAGKAYLLPDHAKIDPAGTRAVLLNGTGTLPDGTPILNGKIISSSISPDGRYLAALTWNQFQGFLTIIDLTDNKVIQQVGTGTKADPTLGDGNVSTDGPYYSDGGRDLWVGQGADLVHFKVDPSTGMVDRSTAVTIPLTETVANLNSGATTRDDLPSGMAFADYGNLAYVALNGANQVGVIDVPTNRLVKVIDVGVAPRQVVIANGKLFVSDEGGQTAHRGEFTNLSYGTQVVANPSTGAATTGEVTVVNLRTGNEEAQIPTGLQPTAELLADGMLFVANSNDDSVTVINPATDRVVTTIAVDPLAGAGSTVGGYPNALDMIGHTLLVSIGRDNAIAEYQWGGPQVGAKLLGLIPTDWYPVDVTLDPRLNRVVVTNDMGVGAFGPPSTINKGPGTSPAPAAVTGHNTYDSTASITEFHLPTSAQLASYTHDVFVYNDWEHLLGAQPVANPNAKPVAIPAAIGSPSLIKHVFLIVRENRTYDQVFGDIPGANGDPALAQFGQKVTPNAHALEEGFTTFDNYYNPSTLSADGHNWLVQADPNDYIQKEFGAFVRSYPAQGGDALAYQRDGFLWNAAARAGRSVQAFGEYNNFIRFTGPVPTWSEWYRDALVMEHKAPGPMPVPESAAYTYSDIPSLNAIDVHAYPAFDLDIPDQYRADVWLQSFRQDERTGHLADLTLIWLPDDHTSGNTGPDPYPSAEVADNDLALGRIISAISHSRFWKTSAIFVTEDDSQNGLDHVDGHRGPLLVVSPYAKRHFVDHTYYNQVSVVRTIEQILGITPMNQEDLAAEPMFNAFTNTPNYQPFTYLPNNIPLNFGVTSTPNAARPAVSGAASSAAVPSNAAPQSVGVPRSEWAVYRQWVLWGRGQHFGDLTPLVDWANPAQLNRYDWYTAHNWQVPYPGDRRILAPDQVPGADAPAGYGYDY
jgi:YVTN family beta-propeller protein